MNVVLLADSGALNLKVVYCLAQLGVRIHVVATTPDNIVRRSRHIHAFLVNESVSDFSAPTSTVEWLCEYCLRNAISVIIPGDIGTSGFLAAAGDCFGDTAIYPCSNSEVLRKIHDKWNFASTLMKGGIATPKTALVESISDVEVVADEIGFPVMIKPLSGESSHGVLRFDEAGALTEYILSGRKYSEPPLIAQRFIEGSDIDISVLSEHGRIVLGVTQQLQRDGSLRFFDDVATRQLAEAIVAEYKYHGVAHFDMRIDNRTGELFALECNPRFWYSMPATIWQGVNFLDAGMRLARGHATGHQQVLIPGAYFLPGALLRALRRPWLLRRLTSRNIRGVLQPALDPVPHLLDLYRKHVQ